MLPVLLPVLLPAAGPEVGSPSCTSSALDVPWSNPITMALVLFGVGLLVALVLRISDRRASATNDEPLDV